MTSYPMLQESLDGQVFSDTAAALSLISISSAARKDSYIRMLTMQISGGTDAAASRLTVLL